MVQMAILIPRNYLRGPLKQLFLNLIPIPVPKNRYRAPKEKGRYGVIKGPLT